MVKNIRRDRDAGMSLIELLLAISLMSVVLLGSYKIVYTLSRGNVKLSEKAEATTKLRAAADAIRLESNNNFEFMTESNRVRSLVSDPIKVVSTISAIDPATMSRSVQLTAEWGKDGTTQTQSMAFTLRKIKSKTGGASVRVLVVRAGDMAGVGGVLLSARGQEQDTVQATTGNDGYATLLNVEISKNGVTVTADGSSVRYYVEGPPVSFQVTVPTPETVGGELLDISGSPIVMNRPATIQGYVRHTLTSDPIASARVAVMPIAPLIAYTGPEAVWTDSNGVYRIAVVPGEYGIFLVGNDQHAGLASQTESCFVSLGYVGGTGVLKEPCSYDDLRMNVDPSHIGATVIKDFTTVKRGAYSATVKSVSWSSVLDRYVVGSAIANLPMRLSGYFGDVVLNDGSWKSYQQSIAWKYYWRLVPQTTDMTSNGNGTVTFAYPGPKILGQEYDWSGQAVTMIIQPVSGQTPPPYVPVRVLDPTGTPIIAPYNASSLFPTNASYVYANLHAEESLNEDVYLLNRSALSSVRFNFWWDAEFTTPFSGTPTYYTVQRINYDTANNARVGFANDSTMGTGITVTNVIPGLQRFDIIGYSGTSTQMRVFRGEAQAQEKKLVDGKIKYQPVPLDEVNFGPVVARGYHCYANYNCNYFGWTDNNVSVNNGVFETVPHGGVSSNLYRGELPTGTTSMVIPPATTNFVVNMKMGNPSLQWVPVRMTFPQIAGWEFMTIDPVMGNYMSLAHDNTVNKFKGPIMMVRVGTTGKIYGKVVDVVGQPVIGARVTLWRSGQTSPNMGNPFPVNAAPYADLVYTTVADACQGGALCSDSAQFYFDSIPFVMHSMENLKLTIEAPGYTTLTESSNAYQGMEWKPDFIMIKPVPITQTMGDL